MASYGYRSKRHRDPGPALGIVALVVIIIVSLLIMGGCEASNDADFEQRCKRDFPGAHMDKASKVGYKSYSITRYCLGPNGELWRVE